MIHQKHRRVGKYWGHGRYLLIKVVAKKINLIEEESHFSYSLLSYLKFVNSAWVLKKVNLFFKI